jgi:hypothetical protein
LEEPSEVSCLVVVVQGVVAFSSSRDTNITTSRVVATMACRVAVPSYSGVATSLSRGGVVVTVALLSGVIAPVGALTTLFHVLHWICSAHSTKSLIILWCERDS